MLYFAEVGFDGGTRELARRLDVTQPLIYRYFPSKEDLIQAVYQEVYLTRWRPEWQTALNDAAVPIRDRLIAFYTEFTAAVFTPEWIRIYLFAGLRGLEMNQWWITFVEHHVLRNMAGAVRVAFALAERRCRAGGAAGDRALLAVPWWDLLLRAAAGGVRAPVGGDARFVHPDQRGRAVERVAGDGAWVVDRMSLATR